MSQATHPRLLQLSSRTLAKRPNGPSLGTPEAHGATSRNPYVKPTNIVLPKGGQSTNADSDADSNTAVHPKGWLKAELVGSSPQDPDWTAVGKFNPKPVKLNPIGLDNISAICWMLKW